MRVACEVPGWTFGGASWTRGAIGPAVVFPAWSHDPAVVYCATIDARRGLWQYWSVPVRGGTPRLVFALDPARKQTGGITFATNGRRLYYTLGSDEADVWTMELAARR